MKVTSEDPSTVSPSPSSPFMLLEAPIIEVFAFRVLFFPHKINDADSVIAFSCPQIESVHCPSTLFVVPFTSLVATNSLSSIFQVTSVLEVTPGLVGFSINLSSLSSR